MTKFYLVGVLGLLMTGPALAAGTVLEPHPPTAFRDGWPHQGLSGTFDRAALQRGFQVYKQVCSSCHSMNLMAYRNLTALGFSE
ncbi:MAG: cytochrome c1, partial [Proteobacteria bacterium]|nr:cytochrome c1 [Pseudomonadota bacterium]